MIPALSAFLSKRLVDRSGGHRASVLEVFRAASGADHVSPEQRERTADQRLAALLRHARASVPRFRSLMDDLPPIGPDNAREILGNLPIMTRKEVQEDPSSFLASDTPVAADDATGGSTGTPMIFRVDRATQVAREASLMWANSLAGWQYGERIAMLWGSDKDVASATDRWRSTLRWKIENRRWYNAFDMGEDRMEAFHRDMERFRPHLIVAYAGSIFTFARFLRARGCTPRYPERGVVSSAEVLAPVMRETVETVFRKPVFDRYGNREFGAIAAECVEHDGLHVNESDGIVEINSPDPFTIAGPILVTYLHNRAMPFLRYDTGDAGTLAAKDACGCGRNTIRLAPVQGRQSDMIRTASGRLIQGEYFTHLFYGSREVREFQFVQEELSRYRLLIVKDPEAEVVDEQRWREQILSVVGEDAALDIEYVSSLPPLRSGKRKFTLSRVEA